jgi:hypothetical protein
MILITLSRVHKVVVISHTCSDINRRNSLVVLMRERAIHARMRTPIPEIRDEIISPAFIFYVDAFLSAFHTSWPSAGKASDDVSEGRSADVYYETAPETDFAVTIGVIAGADM